MSNNDNLTDNAAGCRPDTKEPSLRAALAGEQQACGGGAENHLTKAREQAILLLCLFSPLLSLSGLFIPLRFAPRRL
jgi:hypothetical protein